MKNQNEIKHYRIKETKDGFIVQKKYFSIIEIGYLWWKKKLQDEYWVDLTKSGYVRCIFMNENIEVYKTLEEAKQAIENFKKYPIYHNCGKKTAKQLIISTVKE